jgi:MoaA/NifB/PqqE/SkfB family radical SAM enzyme
MDKVFEHFHTLPNAFKTLSISGGEPTLSPVFGQFLVRLSKFRQVNSRFDRVVLTTHGGNLMDWINTVGCVVDHINISRHDMSDFDNIKIFGTGSIPTNNELRGIIETIHKNTACDVTLNCVVKPDVTVYFCEQFIDYAKSLGADAVSFRKEASDVLPTFAEYTFAIKYGIKSESKCPVCRGMEQDVDGFQVRWKGSVEEPSITTKGVYEAVIHPDGNIYTDWGMKVPLNVSLKDRLNTKPTTLRSPSVSNSTSGGGCGSMRGGCGGG